MSTLRFVVVVSVIFGLLFSVLAFEGLALSGEAEAGLAIDQAEDVVASAYEAVVGAEQAGANVSSLIVQLNDAGELLANAQVAFGLGDFGQTILAAGLCSEIGKRVKNEADDLRVEAYGSRVMGSWLAVAGSLVGVVVIVFGGFWGWRVFKHRYYRQLLRMKPEVEKAGS